VELKRSHELEEAMKAYVGDRLVLEGTHIDDPRRIGIITEIHHPDGAPPYLVRWLDGHETLVFPGATPASRQPTPAPAGADTPVGRTYLDEVCRAVGVPAWG
jgi:hypothetical protein